MTAALFSRRPLAAYVRSLFAAGEQGVWYDPSDMSTLYQDSAGTTPVTAVGQPVGLMLDKSRGLTTGSPLTTPNFTDSAWVKSAAVTSHGPLTFTTSGAGGVYKAANNYFTSGRLYEVAVSFTKSDSTTLFSVVNVDGGAASAPVVASSSAATGVLTARWFSVSAGGVYFRLSTAATVAINSISVKEISGNHAFQATSTSRPTYQRDAAGLACLSFDGADDGLQTAAIDLSATDKMTLCVGVAQRTAADGVVVESSTNYNGPLGTFLLYTGGSRAPSVGVKGSSVVGLAGIPVSLGAAQTITMLSDVSKSGRADELKIRQNGLAIAGTYSGSSDCGTGNFSAVQPFFLGSRGGTSLRADMRFYGLIARGALSVAGQLATIERYIAKKSGVSL